MRVLGILLLGLLFSCSNESEKKVEEKTVTSSENTAAYKVSETPLPDDLEWMTNNDDPTFADPRAKKGGTFHKAINQFPLTLRTIGPDSNDEFSAHKRELSLSFGLVAQHAITGSFYPLIATHWAFGDDNQTVYYKINPKAKWSDGKSITADDFIFALEFMTSKHTVAPWYNDHYGKTFEKIVKYDDLTISIHSKIKKSEFDLMYQVGIVPQPKHFYKLNKDWVKNYNWTNTPSPAAYEYGEIKKGKFLVLKRIKNWWGEDLKYLKNRFNYNKIKFEVVRDKNIEYEYFTKGKFDTMYMTTPSIWHDKAKGNIYNNGYVGKLWFFNRKPQADYMMNLNTAKPPLDDINVRLGMLHSLDIEKINKTVLRGDYFRSSGPAQGHGDFENKNVPIRKFDLKKSSMHFEKSGWGSRGKDGIRVKDGKRLSFELFYGYDPYTERLVVLKEQAKKAGVEIKLKKMDGAAAFKAMLEKQHTITYNGWGERPRPQYWGSYHSENANKPQTNNFTNLVDKKMDKLIDGYRNEMDDIKKAKISRDIQQRIYEVAVYHPTHSIPYFRNASWRWIKYPEKLPPRAEDLFRYWLLNVDGGGLGWIDQEAKKETLEAMKSGKTFPPVTRIDTTYKTVQ